MFSELSHIPIKCLKISQYPLDVSKVVSVIETEAVENVDKSTKVLANVKSFFMILPLFCVKIYVEFDYMKYFNRIILIDI